MRICTVYLETEQLVATGIRTWNILLQTRTSGVVGPSMRLISTAAQQCGVVGPSTRPTVTAARQCGVVGPFTRPTVTAARQCGVVGPFMRPNATDVQLSWSVHLRGLLLQTRTNLTIHAAYCYWGCGRTTGWPTYRLCVAVVVFWHKMSSFWSLQSQWQKTLLWR